MSTQHTGRLNDLYGTSTRMVADDDEFRREVLAPHRRSLAA
jgi:hypothetical protein